ncbi:MAG TPA: glycosyltransferase family 4 protein, partial [Solirubrobacteraceae bacterium]|nr:glycosyltransferase family 4 protein [Solirubrobacteraceae bacterium]
MRSLLVRVKRFTFRALRSVLVRAVRAQPRDRAGTDRRIAILLTSAWGMGGTIRAAHNLGKHLAAQGWDVELISAMRTRDEPFFGSFPPGVKVRALDDRRPGAVPLPLRPVRALLRKQRSVLYHQADRRASTWNLWVDVQLVRALRRRTGFLMGTRPGLNILAADLRPPGMTTVALEQMNLGHHIRPLRKAMAKRYRPLDVLVALTEEDREAYAKLLDGRVKLAVIPNTVHDVTGAPADLSKRRVLAAGRFEYQKGYDMLIEAFARVHSKHPDWELRICGHGKLREQFEQAVAEHGLGDVVELPGPSEDLPGEMEQASIYALSSRFEGFPLVLLEAMGKGMAVVAFDCPTGPRDIIADRENGMIVPPKDPEAFAAGLLALIEDEELRRRCGAAAAVTARGYTIEAIGP